MRVIFEDLRRRIMGFRLDKRTQNDVVLGVGYAACCDALCLPGSDHARASALLAPIAAARQAFQRAVALDPDLVVPYYNLANAYGNAGLFDMASSLW